MIMKMIRYCVYIIFPPSPCNLRPEPSLELLMACTYHHQYLCSNSTWLNETKDNTFARPFLNVELSSLCDDHI